MSRVLAFRPPGHFPGPAWVKEFSDTARRLQRERENASEEVEPLLSGTPRDRLSSLAERTEFRTCGALEHLGTIIENHLAADPEYAEHLGALAVSIAEELKPPMYPRIIILQTRAHAWRRLGEARSAGGKHDQALEAFRTAERILGDEPLAHDRAIVGLALARTYKCIGRHEEAKQLIARCRVILDDHGDIRGVLLADSIASFTML